MSQLAPAYHVEASAGNQMAWMNTIFGLQRTLLAAERTATTFIIFGFTLTQMFQNLKSQVPRQLIELGPHIPRDAGLLMIAGGVGSLALFTWQYQRAVEHLSDQPFHAIALRPRVPLHQLTCMAAYAIMLIGVLAFLSVLLIF